MTAGQGGRGAGRQEHSVTPAKTGTAVTPAKAGVQCRDIGVWQSLKAGTAVTPAKAGVQCRSRNMDPGFRRDDDISDPRFPA